MDNDVVKSILGELGVDEAAKVVSAADDLARKTASAPAPAPKVDATQTLLVKERVLRQEAEKRATTLTTIASVLGVGFVGALVYLAARRR